MRLLRITGVTDEFTTPMTTAANAMMLDILAAVAQGLWVPPPATNRENGEDEAPPARDRERPLPAKKNMTRVGGFQSFNTARRCIQRFEAMVWMGKGFGFASPRSVVDQNQMLGFYFGPSEVNEA